MIMTTEEKQLLIEIKDCLAETLHKVKEVYGNSGYFQYIDYKASNDNYENWLYRARQAHLKAEDYLTIQNLENKL